MNRGNLSNRNDESENKSYHHKVCKENFKSKSTLLFRSVSYFHSELLLLKLTMIDVVKIKFMFNFIIAVVVAGKNIKN